MPDRRRHRGPEPRDPARFAERRLPDLRRAVADLSWLLGRGYAPKAALVLVGDRFQLDARQRTAIRRVACSDEQRERREALRLAPEELAGAELEIDGFNVLVHLETALSGGVVLVGRDGARRDLANVRGTWRPVEETDEVLALVGAELERLGVARARWWLDRPVSNSGRLAARLRRLAEDRGWPWEVRMEGNCDPALARSGHAVATSDSWILDRCSRWVDLAGRVADRSGATLWRLELGSGCRADRGGPPAALPTRRPTPGGG